jgi:hypothetical protein
MFIVCWSVTSRTANRFVTAQHAVSTLLVMPLLIRYKLPRLSPELLKGSKGPKALNELLSGC